jgi:MFS family permease
MYIVGRFLQGSSGGVVWTVGLALISDVAGPENVATLMGYPGIALSFGLILGPLIGGIVYDKAGYYAVFGVCFGILVVDVALRLIMKDIPRNNSQQSDVSTALPPSAYVEVVGEAAACASEISTTRASKPQSTSIVRITGSSSYWLVV